MDAVEREQHIYDEFESTVEYCSREYEVTCPQLVGILMTLIKTLLDEHTREDGEG